MSFILDALRKAETRNRNRHDLTVPTGPRVLTEELPEAPAKRRSAALIVPVLVIVAGVLIWFLRDDGSQTVTRPDRPVAAEPAPQPAAQTPQDSIASANSPMPAERTNLQRETGARALDREARKGLATRTPARDPQSTPATDTRAATSRPITPGTVRILEPGDGEPDQESQLPTQGTVRTETLPEYRSALTAGDVPVPQLHLDMHVYSRQPEKRFVFINLEKYAEGDAIDGDTVVESIEAQGAVINYKGYRFVLRPQ